MHNEKTGIEKFFGLIIILLPLLMIPTILFGGETDKKPERNSESQADYVLMVKGSLISLKAKDASLKEILEEIGGRMKIEVVANIPSEDKITVELDMMYLGDALKRFRTNYAYITESEKERGKITKIVVVPTGVGKMLPHKFSQSPIQKYNPQPPIQKFEHESQPPMQKHDPQPPIQKFVHEPQPTTVRSEHESQSSSTVTENESQPPGVKSDYDPQPSIIEKNNK